MTPDGIGSGERLAGKATQWTGSNSALASAVLIVIAWVVTGPLVHCSDAWQLVINSITSVATFLMVFLIKRAPNKDALAVPLKLDEMVAAMKARAPG